MVSGMWLQIDPLAAEPLFRQVCASIKAAVARGQLREGDRLPSVRELAHELAINPNTVAKAYGELEHEGIIVRRQGAGCFVHGADPERSAESRRLQLQRLTDKLAIEAFHLGLDHGDLRQALEQTLATLCPNGAPVTHSSAEGPASGVVATSGKPPAAVAVAPPPTPGSANNPDQPRAPSADQATEPQTGRDQRRAS
jgi:GntR family transcriptional regulator